MTETTAMDKSVVLLPIQVIYPLPLSPIIYVTDRGRVTQNNYCHE